MSENQRTVGPFVRLELMWKMLIKLVAFVRLVQDSPLCLIKDMLNTLNSPKLCDIVKVWANATALNHHLLQPHAVIAEVEVFGSILWLFIDSLPSFLYHFRLAFQLLQSHFRDFNFVYCTSS